MSAEIAFLSAVEAAAKVRSRTLSPVDLVRAAAEQHAAADPIVNSVVTPDYDRALVAARVAEDAVMRGDAIGPLHGLPIGIKDMVNTAGLRTTFGSPLFTDNVPDEDALVVDRLRAAGGLVIGKTNTPEFGFGMNTRNEVFGYTVNPWDTNKTCGGSSGGSAVALSIGACALAEGGDHGGSLRIPASFCGVVGFRCSPGRVPTFPSNWLFDSFSVQGPMARTVRDAGLMLSAMAGPDARVPISISESGAPFADAAKGGVRGWKVAWAPTLGGLFSVDEEIAEITAKAAALFTDMGAHVEQDAPDLASAIDIIPTLRTFRTAVVRQRELNQTDAISNVSLKDFMGRAQALSGLEVARAEWLRSQLAITTEHFFRNHDVMILPTMQMAAFDKELAFPPYVGGVEMPEATDSGLSCYLITMTGLPAISIPCGFTKAGLPVGLQIVGPWRREDKVLRAAAAYEDATDWTRRRPPVLSRSAGEH